MHVVADCWLNNLSTLLGSGKFSQVLNISMSKLFLGKKKKKSLGRLINNSGSQCDLLCSGSLPSTQTSLCDWHKLSNSRCSSSPQHPQMKWAAVVVWAYGRASLHQSFPTGADLQRSMA